MDLIEIEIINWDKYNPRNDRTITVWFRFQNDFFLDQKLWGISDAIRITFLFLLCECSKVQRGKIKLQLDYMATQRHRSHRQILEDIKTLTHCGVLSPQTGGRKPDKVLATIQDNTKQTIQNNNAHAEAFALFWAGYPNKKGKTEAEKKYRASIKAGARHEDICLARDKYRDQLAREGTEKKFILHGSTFMGRYKEFLDVDYGSAEMFSAPLTDAEAREKALFAEEGV